MKPWIGISVCIDRGKRLREGQDYWYVSRAYTKAIAQAGGIPTLLNLDMPVDEIVEKIGGLVLTGGDDLPCQWGDPKPFHAEDEERVAWERQLLDRMATQKKPILGICYGMQLMNLHFGGTLGPALDELNPAIKKENLETTKAKKTDHGGRGRQTHHPILIRSDSTLFKTLGSYREVSSCHQQVIRQIAAGFRLAAEAPDGVIEAIENKNMWGIEWHPEMDSSASKIYEHFIKKAWPAT